MNQTMATTNKSLSYDEAHSSFGRRSLWFGLQLFSQNILSPPLINHHDGCQNNWAISSSHQLVSPEAGQHTLMCILCFPPLKREMECVTPPLARLWHHHTWIWITVWTIIRLGFMRTSRLCEDVLTGPHHFNTHLKNATKGENKWTPKKKKKGTSRGPFYVE